MRNLRGLFVTGTDTGVGKTFVTAAIVRALRWQGCTVGAYKPVVSGSVDDSPPSGGASAAQWTDLTALADAVCAPDSADQPHPLLAVGLSRGELLQRIGPQRFHAPLAPPVAARREGREVDAELLRRGVDWWRARVDVLLVEGAGGLLSPVSERDLVADVARDLGYPLLIVARLGLGTINHTLLTIEAAQARGLSVLGVVLNDAPPIADPLARDTNPAELAARCPVPVLAVFPYCGEEDLLHADSFRRMDWNRLI